MGAPTVLVDKNDVAIGTAGNPLVVSSGGTTDQDTNLVGINGVAPSVNNGMADAGTQRVTLASDSTGTLAVSSPAVTASTATIANAASLSDAVTIAAGKQVRGFKIPAAWTAAVMTFDVSYDGTNYFSLTDPNGVEFQQAVTVDTFVPFPTVVGITNIKLRSGTKGSVVAQGAQRLVSVLVG
jgi:hypothetical protein